jgi:hypothetical protein
MNPTTPEERRAYAAQKAREWYATPQGQEYQLVRRHRLFHPDWKVKNKHEHWTFEDDVVIFRRDASDRELAKALHVTIPALRQRRIRLKRLLLSAQHHAKMAADQVAYARRLAKAVI